MPAAPDQSPGHWPGAALWRSVIAALTGISWLIRTQRNARIHLVAAAGAIGLALWLGLSSMEWAILWLTIGLVLTAEGLNTALEAAVDLASPTYHRLARIAKDAAAGAVLLAALTALAVGLTLFAGRLITRLVGPG